MTPAQIIALILQELPQLAAIAAAIIATIDGAPTPAQSEQLGLVMSVINAHTALMNYHVNNSMGVKA